MPLYLQREIQELDLGDHVCFVYSNNAEQVSGLVTWIVQGLKRSEQCFCIQHPHTSAAVLKGLIALGVNARTEVDRGSLVMCDISETYLPSGNFDPVAMERLLSELTEKATATGFTGFRATGDMSWALENKPGSHYLLDYEATMESFFANRPALGMCQYHAKQFPEPTLEKTMRCHGTTFREDERLPNHYRIRLRKQHVYADILKAKGPTVCYHYVVQRDGSAEVLAWGQAADLGRAKSEATAWLRQRLD